MHATEALVRPKGCVTGVQNLGLPAENIWQNTKFGKGESILAQNPAVGRVGLPAGLRHGFV